MSDFKNLKKHNLLETKKILEQGGLAIHPAVGYVSLEGSRGLKGGFRDDSDLDLSLILKPQVEAASGLCRDVVSLALDSWQSNIELDLAVVFDRQGCGLKCFQVNHHDPGLCPHGIDCLGVYKIQKGFTGFIENMGLEVKMMYPVLIIWRA